MKYGFIGCGNMGGAIARALSHSTKDILLADFLPENTVPLAMMPFLNPTGFSTTL